VASHRDLEVSADFFLKYGNSHIGKFGGCTMAAIFSGLPVREACLVGVMMNTRALMELVVINIGYDLGVIPKSVFFMLVFMAVVTTFMTTPIFRLLIQKSEYVPQYQPKKSKSARGIEDGSALCESRFKPAPLRECSRRVFWYPP
jgi:hypothetical protein